MPLTPPPPSALPLRPQEREHRQPPHPGRRDDADRVSITPRDTTTEWKAGGSPTWDPTTQIVTFANGTKAGPFASDNAAAITVAPGVTTALSAFPAGLIGGYNGFYAHPTVFVDNNRIQDFTITKTNNAVTGTALPTNPFNGGNSTLRYLQSGTDIMRRFSVLGLFVFVTVKA